MTKLEWHHDPGHEWLAVSGELAPLARRCATGYDYDLGGVIWLEGDASVAVFARAYEEAGYDPEEIRYAEGTVHRGDAPCRSHPRIEAGDLGSAYLADPRAWHQANKPAPSKIQTTAVEILAGLKAYDDRHPLTDLGDEFSDWQHLMEEALKVERDSSRSALARGVATWLRIARIMHDAQGQPNDLVRFSPGAVLEAVEREVARQLEILATS